MTVSEGAAAGFDLARVRPRLVLALDVEDLAMARSLAGRLRAYFGVVKVGLELFVAEGPRAVQALKGEGFDVFLDLKLHDIPTTVARAARRASALGATYLSVHAAGGEAMLRAGVGGFGARGRPPAGGGGRTEGGVLAITVLTSDPAAPAALLAERVSLAARAGCAGVVCAASDLAVVRRLQPSLLTVVPGLRLAGSSADDQARTATPAVAAGAGAGLLVIGRTVTHAEDPEAAALLVATEVANA